MSTLKLSASASFYTWARPLPVTTTATSSSASSLNRHRQRTLASCASLPPPPPHTPSPSTIKHRITHTNPPINNNYIIKFNYNRFNKSFLGFLSFRALNNHNHYPPPSSSSSLSPSSSSSFSSSSSSSPSARSGSGSSSSESPSSGSGSVMGSENKPDDLHWYQNDLKTSRTQPPSMPNHHHHTKLLTLPTILTLGRVAAVPLLIATFYVDSWWGRTATTSIFIAAAITDWLDGYLARKMRLGTAFGAFLDPVADKLMVAATLILLCSRPFEVAMFGQVPWLLTVPSVAIIGREITMSAVREWAASQNSKLLEAVAVNNLGKWKTATQMTALTILLATRDSSLGGSGILVPSGVGLLYISAGLSVWSLAVYMSKIWKVLLK